MHATSDLTLIKRVMLYTGAVTLVTGCLMTFEFGRSMSWLHGLTLCLLSVVAAFVFPYVSHLWRDGARGSAIALALIGGIFLGAEFFSHLGYTVGHRVRDTEESQVQNVKYADSRDAVKDNRALIELAQKELAALTTQHAWAATVSADGLKAKLEAADKAIELETARGGCKSRCLALMKSKADLEERIKVAEKREDLTKQIAGWQKVLDTKRTESAKVQYVSSKIINQTKFVSQLATGELEPSKEAFTWSQIAIGVLIAFVTTFLAPVCFFIALRDGSGGVLSAAVRTPREPSRSPLAPVPGLSVIGAGSTRTGLLTTAAA